MSSINTIGTIQYLILSSKCQYWAHTIKWITGKRCCTPYGERRRCSIGFVIAFHDRAVRVFCTLHTNIVICRRAPMNIFVRVYYNAHKHTCIYVYTNTHTNTGKCVGCKTNLLARTCAFACHQLPNIVKIKKK